MTEQKILTVDDDKVIRLIVSTAFRRFACKILEAADGVQGLAVADRERPDLILLDNEMPVMDGTEMLTRLKANPETRNIPVLMLTVDSRRNTVMRILRLGVRDYLLKPFTSERMLERVSRIIELKARAARAIRSKRSDDPLQILVVDDKPAITELIVKGFAGTPWQAQVVSEPGEALEACNRTMPDVILISLSLPGGAGFALFLTLRATAETKAVPILALSVKTAGEEQARAQQLGFSGLVTKPIDAGELQAKITRALSLDTSYRFFQRRDNLLVISLPGNFSQGVANDISAHLRQKVTEAVDAGLKRVVMDMSALKAADVVLIKLGLAVIQLCNELEMRCGLIGSEAVCRECKNYEETKDWQFMNSFQEALAASHAKTPAMA